MLEWMNDWITRIMDPFLSWLLLLPTDIILVVVAVGTAAILTGVRLFSTDQDLLRRCSEDKNRLKALMREAKKKGDKEAIGRHRTSVGMVGIKQMCSEGWPLLASLLPIVLLATWCFNRIGFHPAKPSDPVEIAVWYPLSAIGQLTHLTPSESSLAAENGWVQEVVEDPPIQPSRIGLWLADKLPSLCESMGIGQVGEPVNGVATWTIQGRENADPYHLAIHYKGKTFDKPLRIGQRYYEPTLIFYDEGPVECAEVRLKPVKLFGVVPGIDALMLPPWVFAYLLLVIPLSLIIKRVFNVY